VELQFFASVRESEQRKLKTTAQPHLNCIDFGRKALSQKTEDRKFSATDVSGQQREHLTKGPGDGPPSPNQPRLSGGRNDAGAVWKATFRRVAPFLFLQYIARMLWRNSRGRPMNAPAAFIHPCQPIVAKQPPSGPGWAHELKHDGYRLQIHVRDGDERQPRHRLWAGGLGVVCVRI
jgi:ATP-dependent DNA ligase